MEGVYEICPGPTPIPIAGRTWQASPLTLADLAAMERKALERRRAPLAVAAEAIAGGKLDRDLEKHLLSLAFAEECRGQRATLDEMHAFRTSTEGRFFEWWLRLKPLHPDLTPEAVFQLFTLNSIMEANAAAARATGEQALGNFTKPSATESEATPATASPGVASSADFASKDCDPLKSAA